MSEESDTDSSKKGSKILKMLVLTIISLFLVWFLLTRITIDDFKDVMSKVQPIYLVLGFLIYFVSYIFRSIRFYFLLGKEVRLRDLFTIVCVHNMINKVLPARTGELSYIYLLKKYKIPLEERIATLAAARMFDFITIASFFLISVFFLKNLPDIVTNLLWIIAISLIILIFIFGSLIYKGESFKNALNRVASKLRVDRFKITSRILKITEDTILAFKTIKSRKIILKSVLFSILIWMSLFTFYYSLTKVFQIDLQFFEIIVIVSVIALLPILPIYAVGGFGTTEVTVTIFFVAFGVSEAVAIVASFSIHIIGLIFVIILGISGVLKLGFKEVRKGKDSEQGK